MGAIVACCRNRFAFVSARKCQQVCTLAGWWTAEQSDTAAVECFLFEAAREKQIAYYTRSKISDSTVVEYFKVLL